MIMKIKAVLESHLPRIKVKSFLKKLSLDEVTTGGEIEKETGVDRRTSQSAMDEFCKQETLFKTKISSKAYYGSKKAIKALEDLFKERYGVL